jgi:tetratricopeptide (TPR) repeat protein
MSEVQWDRVRELFHHALDLPTADRSAFLKTACTEAEIRAEVESLLGHADSNFLDSPAVEGLQNAIEAAIDDQPVQRFSGAEDSVIGRYQLMEKIGEGGMGEVWRAEQTGPIHRQVAFKLVKAGMNTRQVIARFESERQTLALMDHPAIAKVFDAGSTPQRTPYFVMEYVEGVPITSFCDDRRLTTRERLELFMRVCEGVQHAHQKAIIHRDLKPSNILVTEVDGKAAPKIIDFGVARALARKFSAESMLTQAGALVGTPEYMSPEQASLSTDDIDTRTDVYSLGIILYELLSGVRPIDLETTTLEEFLRRLREAEPEKPSTRIRTQDEASQREIARKRQIEPGALAKQMSGDLDSITLKALEKDRSRRYSSPSEFAADIARYLRHERVMAVPPSPAYRARKFVRRYRTAVVISAAFVLTLIAAAAISIRQSIRANREAAVAQAVNDFLQNDLLAQASASVQAAAHVKPDAHLEVRTALDRAAVRIAGKFGRQPEVEAAIRDTIGQAYMDLGLYPKTQTQLERALELERHAFGPKNPTTLKTISHLGRAAFLQGKYGEAEAILSQSLRDQRRVVGPDHADTLYSMNNLAVVYDDQGKYAQAEALLRQTVEIRRRVLGPEHPDTLSTLKYLADVYFEQGAYAQAAALHNQVLEMRRRVLGPEHPDTLGSMMGLANVYYLQGKYPAAESLLNQALAVQRRVLGPAHKDTLTSINNLAVIYDVQGKYAQAEALDRETLEIRRRVLGPEHPDTLMSMNNLGAVYQEQGKYAQAEALYKETLEIRRRVLGPEHADTVGTMNNLADIYTLQEKYAQAEALFSTTVEIGGRKLGQENPYTISFVSSFASMYQRQGKYALAETWAAQALARRRHAVGPEQPETMSSAADLALAYVSEGRFAQSEPLAREAWDFNRRKQPDDWQRFRSESLLGASLAGQKKYPEAEPLLLEGYEGMLARKERMAVEDWYHLDRAREWIVRLYLAWGRPRKAAEWRTR